jgi:hypothetical protein
MMSVYAAMTCLNPYAIYSGGLAYYQFEGLKASLDMSKDDFIAKC